MKHGERIDRNGPHPVKILEAGAVPGFVSQMIPLTTGGLFNREGKQLWPTHIIILHWNAE